MPETAVPQWEHRAVPVPAASTQESEAILMRLGAEGWEVVASAGVRQEHGFNALVMVLKRPIIPPAGLPDGTPAEWYEDPCGRWDRRYWDGYRWTAHVVRMVSKERGIDPPQTLPWSSE